MKSGRAEGNGSVRPGTSTTIAAPPTIVENDAHSFVKGSRGIDLYLQEITVYVTEILSGLSLLMILTDNWC